MGMATEGVFQSPINRVSLLHHRRSNPDSNRRRKVSIPYKSGLTFTPLNYALEIKERKVPVSIPYKSGLTFTLFFGAFGVRTGALVSIPYKSGLTFTQ
jgi:hypothetical protein